VRSWTPTASRRPSCWPAWYPWCAPCLNPLIGTVRGAAARLHPLERGRRPALGTGVVLLGYYLGQVDIIGKNLEVVAALVVLISVLPIAREILKQGRKA